VGPDRGRNLRNIAILLVLAVVVWQVPGGDNAGSTVANVLSIIFIGGLLFLGFRLYPMLRAVEISFQRYDLLTEPRWVGLDNYIFMLVCPEFRGAKILA
jgi:hypothetical protein